MARRVRRTSRGLPRSRRNSGKAWSPAQKRQLRKLARGNTPTGVIGLKTGRSKSAVRTKASQLGISLKPVNRSPYNRRKK